MSADQWIGIAFTVGPYVLPFIVGFVLGWLSRWTRIDKLTADLSRARAEVNGDKIHEPRAHTGTGRRRTRLPDVSTAGVSYVPAGGTRVPYVESRYEGGKPAVHDTQPIPTIKDPE
jgi:hypothetical protein